MHRDLKPSNIMLEAGPDGREVVKLIDFGLVKLMPGYGVPNQKLTEAGYTLGTCHYMSPEQCLGASIDRRSDIYACAAILYQCISGERPFDQEDAVSVMTAHINELAKPLSNKAGSSAVIDAFQAVVNKGLAKDPDDRYQFAAEMASDLGSIIRGESGKLSQQGRTSQKLLLPPDVVRQAQKKRLRYLVPVVAGLAATIFFTFQFLKEPQSASTSDNAQLNVYDEIAVRPVVPPVQPLPPGFRNELIDLDISYNRGRLSEANREAERLWKKAEDENWSAFQKQLIALKCGRIYDAAGRLGAAQKLIHKALAFEEMPDPVLRADLQEAEAQAAWLNRRFATAREMYDGQYVNGGKDRRKRALLGLTRIYLWNWDAVHAKPYMRDLETMMTPLQRDSLTMLLLNIAYAASARDDAAVFAYVGQLRGRKFNKPEDTYNEQLLNRDCELAQSALLHGGYRQLLTEVREKTGSQIADDELLNTKYHH